MLPERSAVSGPTMDVFGSIVSKGLMRIAELVNLLTFQIDPPAPGTYSTPFANAGWNTGSQKSPMLPGGFQSDANCQTGTSAPFRHEYFVSFHSSVMKVSAWKKPLLLTM